MLNLIYGRNYADKTEYIRELAAREIKDGKDGLFLIVPEQYSYESSRRMLEKVGAEGMLRIQVLGLTRLAELILSELGKSSAKPPVDDGVRMLTMNMALEELKDRLEIFKKHSTSPMLSAELVSFATELKQCSVSVEQLTDFADSKEESTLKSKLNELGMILPLYYTMLEKDGFDTDDVLTRLDEALTQSDYFKGKTVFINEFSCFTKQELNVIEKILVQSDRVFISYTTDPESFGDEYSVFANVNKQIGVIKQIAQNNGVEIAEPVILTEDGSGIDKNLLNLEKNIFLAEKKNFDGTPDSIELLNAPDRAGECDYVAFTVKKLLRENGVRCRDIAVYQRSKGSYDDELGTAFLKYGVPFYEDRRQPLASQPLVVYLHSLLELTCRGFTTEMFMRWLKTGLTSLNEDEISSLENYAFMWRIKTSQWKNAFTDNPYGYGIEINNDSRTELERLNKIREKAVVPVLSFAKAFNSASGEGKAEVIYDFLNKNKITEKLHELAVTLSDEGREYLYDEQNTVWEHVIGMLERLYIVCTGCNISAERFLNMFDALLSVSDFGTLPQGLDDVILGVADRSRLGCKKYVFIIGANDGVFPLNPPTQGLLNDRDRITLRKAGIELAETADYKQTEEQFAAYRTVCSAREKLFVTFSRADYDGNILAPSAIVNEITAVFPKVKRTVYDNIPEEEKIESDASAFEAYARSLSRNEKIAGSLAEYFKGNEIYSGRINTLQGYLTKKEQKIKNPDTAVKLFGKDMYLSATKTESYHKCPFMYFCKYGLNAEPRKRAEVDSSLGGTIVHEAFEIMLKKYSREVLENADDKWLKEKTDEILKNYLNQKMGGEELKSRRFMKLFGAFSEQIFNILKRIIEEFRVSEFVPVDFELKIGGEKPDIPAYKVLLDDGGSLSIKGSVDRVDEMDKNGRKYIRIIDYKSGIKQFKLNEVFHGINAQMLIYLYAIYANGGERYGETVPSGIFYLSAKPADSDLGRNAGEDEINNKILIGRQLKGMAIDDETALNGMEKDLKGIFLPITYNSDGSVKGNVISFENLLRLKKEIDNMLKETAEALHQGIIDVKPLKGACDYCDFAGVCGFNAEDGFKDIKKEKFDDSIKMLENKYPDGEVLGNG
ncbi:MAG: hypothetical protein E7514_01255 [Ruminococcaceae bacterium]|nr:hypothetical protein [Oscillospiraceae bacterium]